MGLRHDCDMTLSYIGHTIFRFVQLIMALAVCGLYGVDLHKANSKHKYTDSRWVYAEVVASLSAFSAVIYMIPFVIRIPMLFIWDTLLFILWITLFGVFGKLYIKADAEGDSGIKRMKNAVWVDLVNALLWLISAAFMVGYWLKHRSGRTQFTGRATV